MKQYIVIILFIAGFSTTAMAQSEPPYGMSEIEAYSIFYDNYRQGDYNMALQFGKWMLEKKPREIEGFGRFSLPTQYDRMRRIYTEIAEQQEDPSLKEAYFDTARIVFQDALDTFSEEEIDRFEWKFNLGQFYQRNSSFIEDGMDKAYSMYEELFNENPERLSEASDGYYARILLQKYVNDGEREKALEMIDIIEPLAGNNLQEAISDARDELFSDPVERIEFLEGQLADDPENTELLNELATLYEGQGNREKAIEMAERLYELEPNFENTRQLANIAMENADYSLANEYLKEAAEKAPDTTTKRDITLEIADTYQNMENYRQARRYARQASELDPSWGQPFIRIARIYAGTISSCTGTRKIDRDDRRVYWLVLDYLDRARSVDSSVSNEVQRLYNAYEPVLPTDEDKFFRGWEAGDQIAIDGSQHECYSWINETTTVR
ncbi:tetratricopeptide repeat protein [Rhodohalobacter sp. 8-1]|uniref:tetratricopeptide repeat protein n=1 Tax=Rhodohalobacter sp. 8-1 TaxID=3131972 RepID=UPI0030EE1658